MITLSIVIKGMQLKNPLNGSQGFTKGAAMAAAQVRKRQRFRTKLEVQAVMLKFPREMLEVVSKAKTIAVKVTRISNRKLDAWDGLPAALKPVVDGIADAFGQRDDWHKFKWTPEQEKGKIKQHDVRIDFEFI